MLTVERDYLPPAQLVLPFSAKAKPVIDEGYLYSAQEVAIHGMPIHFGIDFALPVGTPVYAVRDGYVLQSEHIGFTDATELRPSVGFGLGNFVAQLCRADNGREFYVTYAHLSTVNAEIPKYEPEWAPDGSGDPKVLYQAIADFQAKARKVTRGELIGYVGTSGLAKSRGSKESWDDPHLHIEIFSRIEDAKEGYRKDTSRRFDPFDLYQEVAAYRGVLSKALGANDLWIRDQSGVCLYAVA